MAGRIIGGPDRPTPATLAGRPCLELGAVTQRAVVGAVGADIPRSVGDRSSPSAWAPMVSALRKAARNGTMLPFVISYGGRVAGQLDVSNIVHGVLRCCTVGYWVDAAVAGRGLATTALALAVDHCFTTVGLHRVEVDIRPENAASLRVVEKLGLRREAYYERFLDIAGGWRDHIGFAITVEELRGTSMIARLPPPP